MTGEKKKKVQIKDNSKLLLADPVVFLLMCVFFGFTNYEEPSDTVLRT